VVVVVVVVEVDLLEVPGVVVLSDRDHQYLESSNRILPLVVLLVMMILEGD
jgi:hypothetical protein